MARDVISALDCIDERANRWRWICRAASTRSRIDAELSPGVNVEISSVVKAGTSTWRSMRSSSGPEILARYRAIWAGVQMHCRRASLKYPQPHSCGAFLSSDVFRPETGRPPLRTGQSPSRNTRRSLPGTALVSRPAAEGSCRGDRRQRRHLPRLGSEPQRSDGEALAGRDRVPRLLLA